MGHPVSIFPRPPGDLGAGFAQRGGLAVWVQGVPAASSWVGFPRLFFLKALIYLCE